MATKYQEYYQRMIETNKQLFADFQKLHDEYVLNPDKHQEEFNQQGGEMLKIIREWEGKLCRQSEVGGYGQYTSNLAEKFQNEIRKHFPKIDNVGIIPDRFSVKKIKLT